MPLDEKSLVKRSRYLARPLRHQPEALGLTLEPGGWVAVDALLAAEKAARRRADLRRARGAHHKPAKVS